MSKKSKNNKLSKYNITKLNRHERHKSTLHGAFSKIADVAPLALTSWKDIRLPNMLWACVLVSALERTHFLDIGRQIADISYKMSEEKNFHFLTHAQLSKATYPDFERILAPVLISAPCQDHLRCLRLINTLPDAAHWARSVKEPDGKSDWKRIATAVAECFDHQSQKATDVRWLKTICATAAGQIIIPPKVAHEIANYPNVGDQRKVRPSIRAIEISFGTSYEETPKDPEIQTSLDGDMDTEAFWGECFHRTGCLPPTPKERATQDTQPIAEELIKVYDGVSDHFLTTITTTDIDARHDGAFAIVLYAIYSLIGLTSCRLDRRAEGRMVLRSIVEAFITLHWLKTKDDRTLWIQYRNYGSGQAKLSLLKNLETDDVPDFIDLEELHSYANEDYWQEFMDIELGAWSNKNLRTISQECGTKDVYDKYYDWSSAYAHSNWTAARDTVMTTCLNPLHRFHRIPWPPRLDMPTVLIDGSKLVNRMLDDLNELFPPFKSRITWHKPRRREERERD